jgi:hypothetical protein
MIGSGEHSTFIRAGVSLEEERDEINKRIDELIDNKPKSLVKRFIKKVGNKNGRRSN